MKLQAMIIVSYRAGSLAEAGEKLCDVPLRATERGDIEIESLDLHTPVRAGAVTLPSVERAAHPREAAAPRATGEGDGASANSAGEDGAASCGLPPAAG